MFKWIKKRREKERALLELVHVLKTKVYILEVSVGRQAEEIREIKEKQRLMNGTIEFLTIAIGEKNVEQSTPGLYGYSPAKKHLDNMMKG